jgi:hypothetical protein
MRGRRGSGHFEMVVAFTFFVGFVVFAFVYLNPLDHGSLPNSAMEGLYNSFVDQTQVPLSTVFIRVNDSAIAADCFTIDLPEELFK